MVLPSYALNFNINTTSSGSGTYTHAISSPTGGIAPYTYSGGYSSGLFTDSNPTITVTVTDNIGCTITKTG